MDAVADSKTLEGTPEEGQRLAQAAHDADLVLLLVGGVAFWVTCPSARSGTLARTYGDVDFVGRSTDRQEITEFMKSMGYEPDGLFNAIHGATRLNYHDPVRNRPIDVLLDRFVMAHELDLRDRLQIGKLTLPLADLLLTKLQVVDLNLKDVKDIVALLLDHRLGGGKGETDLSRILDVTRSDWGFEHTIHRTPATVRARIAEFQLPEEASGLVVERVDRLDRELATAPKSVAWKVRARLGERVRWYQQPEEARG